MADLNLAGHNPHDKSPLALRPRRDLTRRQIHSLILVADYLKDAGQRGRQSLRWGFYPHSWY